MQDGTFQLRKAAGSGELNVLLEMDFTKTAEVRAGRTIASATTAVLLDGVASSHLTLSAQATRPDGKAVQVRVSDNGSIIGNKYFVVWTVTLDDGAELKASVLVYPVSVDSSP